MTVNEDLVSKFIKQAKTEAKHTPPASSRKKRVWTGMLIGICIAFVYSAIAELINILPYPELPLYFHPFGTIGNIIYTVCVGGLAGLISGWSEEAIIGAITGGLVLFVGVELGQLLSSYLLFSAFIPTAFGLLALLFILFTYVLLALIMGLVRLTIDMQLEKPQLSWWHWQKTWSILILLAIAITTGYLHEVPIGWIYSLRMVNRLVQTGLEAQTPANLPEQLREEQMGDFLGYASGAYKLEVNNALFPLFHQADPYLSISFQENVVLIYFESGQDIACLANGETTIKCLPVIRKIKLPPIIL